MNRPLQETHDHLLDATGLLCPEPVMLMHNRMRDLSVDDILLVLATDPSTRRDIPDFCRFLGHELLDEEEVDGTYRYRVRKQGNA
ncbi:sulfurtransferase TusA [Chromatocurvus halotolerans]|uniref:Sulfur carrier protein TusA n=1 Tax=Chromatocurvus halotolerans TaxID=1132028 RepID=A0A4R2KTW0_9GAMM|nr:sulfurtransferase TusA [Chromatocurvus halotolerans]TCO77831.1 tRNA 2-thiouridine synthesizing protein A [Chromatocurvus halotolerans]